MARAEIPTLARPRRDMYEGKQLIVTEAGEPIAVIISLYDFEEMQRRLGEIATQEEERDPEALKMLERAEADIAAGRLLPHEEVVAMVKEAGEKGG